MAVFEQYNKMQIDFSHQPKVYTVKRDKRNGDARILQERTLLEFANDTTESITVELFKQWLRHEMTQSRRNERRDQYGQEF